MSTNLNSIDSSIMSNIVSTYKASTEINPKDTEGALFATQLENSKKTDFYLNEIKNCVPKTTVTVKSMNARDIQKYYEEWKKQPIDYSGFNHSITVSPKVLEKMKNDPKYAEQMLQKIKKAATPEGFGNATIYEYKVIVRDDGEIETLSCADFMNEKNQKIENDDKKKDRKKLELIYSHRRIYDQRQLQTLSEEVIKVTQFMGPQYYFYAAAASKMRKGNQAIDLE